MSYLINDFTQQVTLVYMINKWDPTRLTQATNLATALNPDTTTHSTEIQTAPAGLIPGAASNTPMLNDLLRVVNRGKAGNLTPLAMSNAITNALSVVSPPANTAAPVVSSTSLSVAAAGVASTTNGTWTGAPATYTYQWLRGGAPIFNATAQSYTLAVADETFMLSCRVTAENANGTVSATSNTIGPVTA
jgi:hypothetical protein